LPFIGDLTASVADNSNAPVIDAFDLGLACRCRRIGGSAQGRISGSTKRRPMSIFMRAAAPVFDRGARNLGKAATSSRDGGLRPAGRRRSSDRRCCRLACFCGA
jgi:hypothetical protein